MTQTGLTAYESVDIETYLDHEGIDYKRASGARGVQFNIRECPSCNNERWKTYLNAGTGYGNCFICEKSYNLWTFAAAHLGIDIAKAGPEEKKAIGRHFDDIAKAGGWRAARAKVPEITADVFDGDLQLPMSLPLPTETGQNLKYLEGRGVSKETCAYFHLRYCIDAWWNYTKEDGSKGGVMFGNSVIIPVYDLTGRLVTFQGRDITGESDRKYLFPPRLPGTARYLYNGHNAIASGAKHVVVGEGPIDVWALKLALDQDASMQGITAIGTFGMHLSAGDSEENFDQLNAFLTLQKSGLETVTIMWDGESKALMRALKAADLLHRHGLKCRIAFLPKGCDPAEVSGAVVRECIREAKPYSRSLLVSLRLRNPYS